MSEQKTGGFFSFPLCALAMPLPWEKLLWNAFGYGVIHYADHAKPDWRSDRKGSRNKALELAQTNIGFNGGNVETYLQGFMAVEAFVSEWAKLGRKTYPVRLPTPLFFECREGEGITEREIRILAGVFSVIGSKGYARAGWEVIQWRAAGHLQRPPEGTTLYPRGQIERSLVELRTRALLSCFSYGKGHAGLRYWAPGNKPIEQLAKEVMAGFLKRSERLNREAKVSAEMSALTNVSGTCS